MNDQQMVSKFDPGTYVRNINQCRLVLAYCHAQYLYALAHRDQWWQRNWHDSLKEAARDLRWWLRQHDHIKRLSACGRCGSGQSRRAS